MNMPQVNFRENIVIAAEHEKKGIMPQQVSIQDGS